MTSTPTSGLPALMPDLQAGTHVLPRHPQSGLQGLQFMDEGTETRKGPRQGHATSQRENQV